MLFLLDYFDEPIVFLSGPCDLGVRLDHAEELKVKEVGIFVEECGGEALPLLGGLYRKHFTIWLAEI